MKAYIAMSGGVDSSVSALLMKQAGHDVTGVTLRLHDKQGCGSANDAQEAAAVCEKLGAPHVTWDAQPRFKASVMDHFAHSYLQGRTPNPCIVCNPRVKFQALASLNTDFIATGHYAGVTKGENYYQITRSRTKDQSYMLSRLPQEVLRRLLLPLCHRSKEENRALAEALHLPVARKKDSQDLCFCKDYIDFLLSRGLSVTAGDFLMDGQVVGRHKGTPCYTIGQRKNLGIALGRPAFVTAIDAKNNTVTLSHADPHTAAATVTDLVWQTAPRTEFTCTVKTRLAALPVPATVTVADGVAHIDFDTPVRAVTPGQTAVLYDGDAVLASGFFA